MTNSPLSNGQGRMPSDEQMDGLLTEFFRLEMPLELKQPLRVSRSPQVVASSNDGEFRQRPSHSRKAVVLAALGALALGVCVVVAVRTDDRASGVVGPLPSPESPITVPVDMLVSPNGDLQPSAAVGSDGVTLDETDGVQISPKQQ